MMNYYINNKRTLLYLPFDFDLLDNNNSGTLLSIVNSGVTLSNNEAVFNGSSKLTIADIGNESGEKKYQVICRFTTGSTVPQQRVFSSISPTDLSFGVGTDSSGEIRLGSNIPSGIIATPNTSYKVIFLHGRRTNTVVLLDENNNILSQLYTPFYTFTGLVIGNRSASDRGFTGTIDYFMISNVNQGSNANIMDSKGVKLFNENRFTRSLL